ncbi:MAG: tRNA (N(6)-L-threonylcarbamoyladenosine(37)-C(2))-methylthiotransferase MtaB [Synergistetes bacterium]|nr:tRNA (N(6)-L-threonylcarbamoyladenosine(37)-C(2))-methylthiotransferase MtaB [Synergistota bacterium]
MRVFLFSLGCRVNQSEIEGLASELERAGMRIVASPEEADIIVLNTCAVTTEAERKSRQYVRRFRRLNPGAKLVALGCYVQLVGEKVLNLGADIAFGNSRKRDLLKILRFGGDKRVFLSPRPERGDFFSISGKLHYHSRAFVKVQDGCDAKCSYCLIRILRGKGVSRPIRDIVSEVRGLVSRGYDEITIVGIHLGSYGRDLGVNLRELVEELLKLPGLRLLRLGSVEPFDLGEDFIELYERFDNLAPHLHLPLQSGSNRILSLMRRPYTFEKYLELVEKLREIRGDFNITTDIMIGFPGESEGDFNRTLEAVEKIWFGRIHIFRYSPRPFTEALKMPCLSSSIVERRLKVLKEITLRSALSFNKSIVGKTFDALYLGGRRALLPNYVEAELSEEAEERWVKVKVEKASPRGVFARVLSR